jgi:hypothetical protein
MKKAIVITALLALLAVSAIAQNEPTHNNFAAAGVSYNQGATPSIAGTGLYARRISEAGTYAFTAVDALPTTLRPVTVTTQFSTGIAQRIVTMGKVEVYIPTSAGISYSGTNTGWAWTTGAMAVIPVGAVWRILPNVRMVKSSISAGEGYQLIGGVLFGWGW